MRGEGFSPEVTDEIGCFEVQSIFLGGASLCDLLCLQVIRPNAMCLSTVGEGGKPSARFVQMKGFDKRGVTWYTNYNR